MPFGESALFEYVRGQKRVLVAGAGGGCDVYCGIPLYFGLKARGHEVFLANLSFTNLAASGATRITDEIYEAAAATEALVSYFPEYHLASWFASRGERMSVFGILRLGVAPVIRAYRDLVKLLKLDAIILIDGGTDSLMRGDEFNLATPEEDIASLIAVHDTGVARKALVATAFGVDAYHGICHSHFLENAAHFMHTGGFLGVCSADRTMPEVAAYLDAVEHLCRTMQREQSIVNTSVASAIEGHYGDYHRSHRTAGSKLWINPLMALYWAFELDAVHDRLLYRKHVEKTQTWHELRAAIGGFRAKLKSRREFEEIPV